MLLRKLAEDLTLGLVGTPFQEGSNPAYDYRFASIEHVSGACQVFRRQCFEDIGGYTPVKGGCIDHIAVITARMKGWKTRTFTERVCHHHREMGTAQQSLLMSRFRERRQGLRDRQSPAVGGVQDGITGPAERTIPDRRLGGAGGLHGGGNPASGAASFA